MPNQVASLSRSVRPREIHRSVARVVEPTVYPVTVEQVQRALDMPDDLEDSQRQEILDLIGEATDIVERDTRRALMPQEWIVRMDEFPRSFRQTPYHNRGLLELDWPPVRVPGEGSAVTITYIVDGETETLSADVYEIDVFSEPCRIRMNTGKSWPETDKTQNAVSVRFLAGYPNRESIPQGLRRAVLLAIKHLYDGCELGEAYRGIINRYRWEGVV